MSTKSPHSFITVPDQPVSVLSNELETCFVMLHQLLCDMLATPANRSEIGALCDKTRSKYYEMRNLLEDDQGVSSWLVSTLPLPEVAPTLKRLYEMEQTSAHSVDSGTTPSHDDRPSTIVPGDVWRNLRMCIYEAERILRIAGNRIAQNGESRLKGTFS